MSKKISVTRLTSEARHTVKVPLTLEDEAGNVEEVEARVVYRGLSLRSSVQLDEQLQGLDERASLLKALSSVVISLPDFAGEEGATVEPTEEFWDTLDTVVLNAVYKAIEDDRDPNRKPSRS